jgi:uncharacterized membrane protein
MNRDQFLAQLRKALGRTAEVDKREILADYEEHFKVGIAEGRSEDEIARALGNPSAIGNAFRIESLADNTRAGWKLADVFRAAFASISLGFFNIIVVLGPFLGLVGVLIGMWAVVAALGISGIGGVAGAIAGPFLQGLLGFTVTAGNALFLFFAGVCTAALGVLAAIGMAWVTRKFFELTARYVTFNARIISGRKAGGST